MELSKNALPIIIGFFLVYFGLGLFFIHRVDTTFDKYNEKMFDLERWTRSLATSVDNAVVTTKNTQYDTGVKLSEQGKKIDELLENLRKISGANDDKSAAQELNDVIEVS